MSAADLACARCMWWRPIGISGSNVGLCVRYAPRGREGSQGPDWPRVGADDFCGEFKTDEEQG